MPDDTIIAVSTPPGSGGIGIVRLSGRDALAIARKFFRPRSNVRTFAPRTAVFGTLRDPDRGESFDEGFLTYFKAPHSYTREDIVEISCHGSQAVLEEAVRLGVKHGARLAHPGEFTRRAYLRGRIDILQAEAVNDLVRAASFEQARWAFRTVEGRLSRKIGGLRDEAVRLISEIEAAIEFPDENLPVSTRRILASMKRMAGSLETLIAGYETGRALAHGLTLAILGKTNVGKSTLFNALLDEPRAIVTPFPGTTRDYLREKVKIKDAVFNLVDMAGLGVPSSAVEKEGMKRGRRIASQAEGILFVFDGSRPESALDMALLKKYENKNNLFIINKIDAGCRFRTGLLKSRYPNVPVLEVSALRGTKIGELKQMIYRRFAPKIGPGDEVIYHLRDKLLLEGALFHLDEGRKALEAGYPEEFCAEEIRNMIEEIGRLTGEVKADDVMESVFGRFCVGK
jgi:tRNA modification GTPase